MAGTGALLWAFVLAVPLIHLGLLGRLPIHGVLLWLAPLVVLTVGVQRNDSILCVLCFPVSMIPLLLLEPTLTGPRVYGVGAFAALAVATVAFLFVSLARTGREDEDARPAPNGEPIGRDDARLLSVHTAAHTVVGAAMAGALYFHRPTQELLSRAYPGYEARATVFIGLLLFACWVGLIYRELVGRLGRALVGRQGLMAEWYRFEAEATVVERVHASFGWACLIGLASAIGLALVVWFDK